jgi:hypothetical protein
MPPFYSVALINTGFAGFYPLLRLRIKTHKYDHLCPLYGEYPESGFP